MRTPSSGTEVSPADRQIVGILQDILPDSAVIGICNVDPTRILLDDCERASIPKASLVRQAEFSAGRQSAKMALAKLGFHKVTLPANAQKVPQWPSGTLGSISHSCGLAVAAVALSSSIASVGIDIESRNAVTCELWPYIFTPDETGYLSRLVETERTNYAAAIFSAKESFFKFQFTLTQQYIEFTDINVTVLEGGTTVLIRPRRPFLIAGETAAEVVGSIRLHSDMVFSSVYKCSR